MLSSGVELLDFESLLRYELQYMVIKVVRYVKYGTYTNVFNVLILVWYL